MRTQIHLSGQTDFTDHTPREDQKQKIGKRSQSIGLASTTMSYGRKTWPSEPFLERFRAPVGIPLSRDIKPGARPELAGRELNRTLTEVDHA